MRHQSSALGLALIIASAAPTASFAQSAAAAPPLGVEWAQDHSDLKADPAAHFGRLANGMTYLIYHNATPPGVVSVHLRIAAGSMMEADSQRGLAHFVEHMAFEGSTHIPPDELLPLLQRNGMKIGPDASAFTLQNKTEYVLDAPNNDPATLDAALKVMRETASELLFDPAAIERARQVVLDEERFRGGAMLNANGAWAAAAFPGQRYATRDIVIGDVNVIKSAQRADLMAFYHAFYRPELATLVVVGDVDPAAVEARIKAMFSDWRPVGPAPGVDYGAYRPKGLTTGAYVAPGLPTFLTATWLKPYDPRFQTEQLASEQDQDAYLVYLLNLRLQRAGSGTDAAFLSAAVVNLPIFQTAQSLQLVVNPKPGREKDALIQAAAMLKQFVAYGITGDERDRVFADLEAANRAAVAGAQTRSSPAIAANVDLNIDQNGVFTSPQQDLDQLELDKRLPLAAFNDRLRTLFAGDGPLLFKIAPDESGLKAADLPAIFAQAMAAPAAPYAQVAAKAWPYAQFGAPQPPVSHTPFKDFGFSRYVFANGLTLNIMPTRFKLDQALVSVSYKGGMERFSPHTPAPTAFTALYASAGGVLAGGVGQLDDAQLQRALTGRTIGLSVTLGDADVGFNATTTRADLATTLQLIMALKVDPAYRPTLFDRLHAALPSLYAQLTSTPAGVATNALPGLTHAGDTRYAFPSLAEAGAITADQIKAVLTTLTGPAPTEITIVGDVDEAQTVVQVAQTFATLPTLPKAFDIAPGGDHAAFPTTHLDQKLYHQGRPDQSLSLIAWPTTDNLGDTGKARALSVLTEVINQRLFEQVRERMGQAYDAGAVSEQSWTYKGFGMIRAQASVAAGQDAAFTAEIGAIVADLKAHPISQDELDRARKPLLETWSRNQSDNQHWIYVIPHVTADQTRDQSERKEKDELMAVTPAQIQALATTYLVADKALHLVVTPQPKPAGP